MLIEVFGKEMLIGEVVWIDFDGAEMYATNITHVSVSSYEVHPRVLLRHLQHSLLHGLRLDDLVESMIHATFCLLQLAKGGSGCLSCRLHRRPHVIGHG